MGHHYPSVSGKQPFEQVKVQVKLPKGKKAVSFNPGLVLLRPDINRAIDHKGP